MLYPKNALGRKYTQMITGSPGLFLSFVFCGLTLFLFLTVTTRLDVIETYKAEIRQEDSEITLLIEDANISDGLAYIYSNKNEAVYSVHIEDIESIEDRVALHFNREGQKIIHSLLDRDIFIDIPQGQETLLYRIFMKGGKGRE